jgi:archaellum component FlaF (FlaF/FlaG flagellin family)
VKIWLSSLLLFVFAAGARAQQDDNPVTIPVSYYGVGRVSYCPEYQTASFSFGAILGAASSVSSLNPPSNTTLYSTQQTEYLVPGETYNVTVTSAYMGSVTVNFLPVDGCTIYINGLPSSSYSVGSGNYTFQLTITSSGDITKGIEKQRGGAVTSFAEDKAIWFIGLGQCRNGQFAGALGFRQATITSSLFNTSSLVCTASDPTEVSITRDGGGHIT